MGIMNAKINSHSVLRVLGNLCRVLGALALLVPASFLVFCFRASFEPGNGIQWQAGYAILGSAFLVAAIILALWQLTARLLGGLGLLSAAMFCALGFSVSYTRGLPWELGYGAIGVACILAASALLRDGEKGRANVIRFLQYAVIFGLFGMLSCKFAINFLIPWIERLRN